MGQLASTQNSHPNGGMLDNSDPNLKQVNTIVNCSGDQWDELAPQKEVSKAVRDFRDKNEFDKGSTYDSVMKCVKTPHLSTQKFKK